MHKRRPVHIVWRMRVPCCRPDVGVVQGLACMADTQLKKKVYAMLKEGYFSDPDDAVDVSDGPDDSIHLVISRAFLI